MFIKLCGLTRTADARMAFEVGADCFGLIYNFPRSRHSLNFDQASALVEDAPLPAVLVTVNLSPAELEEAALLYPLALQLHGDESPELVRAVKALVTCEVWKVLHVPSGPLDLATVGELCNAMASYVGAGADRLVIDTCLPTAGDEKRYGGTGVPSDWRTLREVVLDARVPVILAGGLQPANVETAIDLVRPAGVDTLSGIESAPGIKDHQKMAAFVTAARGTR